MTVYTMNSDGVRNPPPDQHRIDRYQPRSTQWLISMFALEIHLTVTKLVI